MRQVSFIQLLCCLLFCGTIVNLQAQTFTSAPNASIPDNTQSASCFPVTVSGLPTAINASFGIAQVCIDIQHTYDADLRVSLKSPDNTEVILISGNGGSGNNFTATCLQNNGANGNISAGNAPFTGIWIPLNSIFTFNNDQNPNGTWQLCVRDMVANDVGTLLDFSISFSSNPPGDPTPPADTVCSYSNMGACRCPDGSQVCDLLPDLTNGGLLISTNNQITPGEIRVSTATPNIGWGPLEVRGTGSCSCDEVPVSCGTTCPDGSSPKEMVQQYITHKNGDTYTKTWHNAGYMQYHPTHGHMHVESWVSNTIRIKGQNPDARTWPIVNEGRKISFCLINLSDCDNSYGNCIDDNGTVLHVNDVPNHGLGEITGCDRDQGIYPGSVDIYSYGLDGQQIDITGICNGKYYLVSITDPENVFLESNDENNWSATEFNFTNQVSGCCETNFKADVISGPAPLTVTFTDSTVAVPNNWNWIFGDGSTSNEQFPSHTYTTPGVYSVKLRTNAANGCSDSLTKMAYITVTAPDVWPGDANHDRIVNLFDFFLTSGAFNKTGPARNEQGIQWHAYTAPVDWSTYTVYQGAVINDKYIDANGDGQITLFDVAATILNRNRTY